ncbi:MAG TPA: adenylate/guanylate cyclase domain-containing protein [Beijerinckiaceae bacterium]|jgi:class 3 adenylate cyclase
MKRKIAAILAADVAGYSRLVSEDEEETLTRLAAFRQVFDDFVGRFGGRIFNTAGDSVMCEFDSAVEAVRCAIDIQESLRTRNRDIPAGRRLQFRIGITIGDVVERGGDLLGDGVNIAARLESLAEPGGICVSRSVHEAVANKIAVPFRDIGEREVKNIPNRVHAFVVAWPGLTPELKPEDRAGRAPAPGPKRGKAVALSAAALAAAGIAFLALRPAPPAPPPTAQQAQAPVKPPEAPRPTTQAGPAPQPQQATGQRAQAPTRPEAPKETAQADPQVQGGQTPAQQGSPPTPADPAEAFQKLAQQGGIVPDPKTAPELYHNARLHEARGDAGQARRAYQALARLGHEHIDPHLRYAALLRVQDGRAGAREAFSALLREKPTRAAALAHALQFEGAERRAKVEAFAAQNPDYAPAHYLLAEEHSEDRIGTQSLTDRRLEFDALERFLEADAEGRLTPFFLDQSVLSQWLDKAKKRKEATQAFFQGAQTKPTASFQRANTGWIAAFHLPEPATALAVRVGETGEFKATGFLPAVDQRTGKPMPNPSLELPADQPKSTLYVRYDDATGRTAGPFPIVFDPSAALAAAQREVLERFPGAWVAFRPDRPNVLYFTHLVANRCAIEHAEMGLDEGPLAIDIPIPECDEANPHAVPVDAETSRPLPQGVRAVSVQLTYVDGTKSGVRTFRR